MLWRSIYCNIFDIVQIYFRFLKYTLDLKSHLIEMTGGLTKFESCRRIKSYIHFDSRHVSRTELQGSMVRSILSIFFEVDLLQSQHSIADFFLEQRNQYMRHKENIIERGIRFLTNEY